MHDAPGGQYRILYQAPPWELIETDGTYLRLEVEANATRFGDLDAGVVPPKFLFEADVGDGDAATRIRRDERSARREGAEIARPATEVTTREGATGLDFVSSRLTADGTRFARVAYLDRDGGGVVRLYFEANDDLDQPQVDAMIADVLVDPE